MRSVKIILVKSDIYGRLTKFSKIIYMDISGKIQQLLPLQTGQGKNGTWKKQEFILETGDAYPKKVCIAVWGDKIDMSGFRPGDQVAVSFDVESREYNGRWYTDVKAWKIVSSKQSSDTSFNEPMAGPVEASSMEDDLPF
jgi:hypothetical protein